MAVIAEAWTLEDGLKLVRALQPESRKFGYHLALGGSVLNSGRSDKDIDLYFLALENDKQYPPAQPESLLQYLVNLWGHYEPIGKEYEGEPVEGSGLFTRNAALSGRVRERMHQVAGNANRVAWTQVQQEALRGPNTAAYPVPVPEEAIADTIPPGGRADEGYQHELRDRARAELDQMVRARLENVQDQRAAGLDPMAVPDRYIATSTGPTKMKEVPQKSVYVRKVKFLRSDGRIDVFVVGGQ